MRGPGGTVAAALGLAVALAGCGLEPSARGAVPAPLTAPASTAPGTSPDPTLAPAPTTTPAPRELSVALTGDVLLHEALWSQAARDARAAGRDGLDFAPIFASIRPDVQAADLAVCHLETPLARSAADAEGYPTFAAPPEVVPALVRTGYDACTTASNHSFDQGAGGVDRTLDALDRAGIAHAGTARTPAEARRTTMLDANGVRVALLSYTYGFNGIPYPDGETWRARLVDRDRVLSDARRARQRGADLVLVALHWGSEYQHEPDGLQDELGTDLVRSPDVDLVYGHHAHVVQPVRAVGREWVVYGLGNLVAHHSTPGAANEEGLLVRATFRERPDGRWAAAGLAFAPLLVTDAVPIRVLDVARALRAGGTASASEARLQTAWRRTTEVVGSLGGRDHGLRPLRNPG